jgi:hypothetical protein
LQTTVSTLLLVTASVVLACIVVDYGVNIFQTALQTQDFPGMDRYKNLENQVLNQTDTTISQYGNQTATLPQTSPTPTLPPTP